MVRMGSLLHLQSGMGVSNSFHSAFGPSMELYFPISARVGRRGDCPMCCLCHSYADIYVVRYPNYLCFFKGPMIIYLIFLNEHYCGNHEIHLRLIDHYLWQNIVGDFRMFG